MTIGIFYKEDNKEIAEKIKKEALSKGLSLDDEKPDIVFSVGGDGTFLRAVHKYIDLLDSVRFVGINSGSLGFFYDFSRETIPEIFDLLLKDECVTKEHCLLKGVAKYQNSTEEMFALNEIRIENPFHTLISNVLIDGEELETFRGNGLIVSSTLGSSAYNKSLGGALIDADIDALELTEVAGISNNVYRSLGSSLVVKADKKITFAGKVSKAVVGYDHLGIYKDDKLLSLEVSYSNRKVKIIYSKDRSYIQRIRKSFVL